MGLSFGPWKVSGSHISHFLSRLLFSCWDLEVVFRKADLHDGEDGPISISVNEQDGQHLGLPGAAGILGLKTFSSRN